MLKTKIQEINLLGNTINRLYCNILNYDLGRDACTVRYELRYRNSQNSVAEPDSFISSGEWKVPANILNNWGMDNYFLAEKLCEHLGLTFVEHMTNPVVMD
jgi:hypothetical protein